MKLSNLKTGMIVRYRNGELRLVLRDVSNFEGDSIVGRFSWNTLSNYNEDMKCKIYNSRELDIVEVYEPLSVFISITDIFESKKFNVDNINLYTCIWEEEKPVEITINEIEEILGYKIKVIEE